MVNLVQQTPHGCGFLLLLMWQLVLFADGVEYLLEQTSHKKLVEVWMQ